MTKPFHGTREHKRSPRLMRLTRRPDYISARGGQQFRTPVLVLQAKKRPSSIAMESADAARIGLTVSRKVGGAVTRNSVKRRLRETIAAHPGLGFKAGYDYVLIARGSLAHAPFGSIVTNLQRALEMVHKEQVPSRGRPMRDRSAKMDAHTVRATRDKDHKPGS